MKHLFIIIITITISFSIFSQEKPDTTGIFELPQIDIIGRRSGLINRIPGSIFKIGKEEIKMINPTSGNEIFKKAAGVNVVDEEGIGLRLNVGIRGLDPDRSRSVLVLEDGVPVSIAPYGEPEMYYTPPMDKMIRVEILKGSGSILFGPQTIGGVINYITEDPPSNQVLNLSLRGGESGLFLGKIGYGTTKNNVGVQLNAFRKQGDNVGVLKYRISDISAKVKIGLSSRSTLGVKIGAYVERSNATYVGITQKMYEQSEYFPVMPENDNLDVKRYTANLTHNFRISDNAALTTTLYGYTTDRIWRRQDFSRTRAGNTTEVWGDTNVTGGAIFMRSTNSTQDRRFVVGGIEPRLFLTYFLGDLKNELDFGLRYHYEQANERRYNGSKPDAESGALVTDEIRTGNAVSGFLQNRLFITNRLSITPGLRYEAFYFDRNVLRSGSRDTNVIAESKNIQMIPGFGMSYFVSQKLNIFAGIHRGYAPPRIKDAININGEVTNLDAELSWNTELGLRTNFKDDIYFELTGYYMDFSNQIIPVSVSSGGIGSGFVNGGRTLHYGVESGFSLDIGKFMRSKYNVILSSNVTMGESKFSSDRFITKISSGDTVVTNVRDYSLPYAPKISLNSSLELRTPFGLGLLFTGNFISSQFTDELNTVTPSNDGLTGEIGSRFIVDVTARYYWQKMNSTIYVSVKNLTDEIYIASRRPQGIKVGLPRIVTAGIDLSF